MNGGVNGTMEESKELSHPNSPENNHSSQIAEEVDETDHYQTSKPDVNNHEDSVDKPSECTNSETVETTNGSVESETEKCPTETSKVPLEENSNNNLLENHSSYNNDSNPGSVDSQAKSETLDETMDPSASKENCKDEESQINTEETAHSNNGIPEEDDMDDDSSEKSNNLTPSSGHGLEDAVSVHSESEEGGQDESSQESQNVNKSTDIILMDNEEPKSQNGNSKPCSSPEVQEIVSDNEDCVIEEPKPKEKPVQLRRSSRTIKRRRYDKDINNLDNSDIEEVIMEDPLKRKTKAIIINDTKTLVEMAAKQIKSGVQKKEPTVVIIDTKSTSSYKGNQLTQKNSVSSTNSLSAQNLYQSIVARGTTVTPVGNKHNAATQSSSTPQPSILPSLTDDMFVVEAPSFIVPYVYEKPSVKPFREFVDNLGNELKQQIAKEEEERKQKEKEEKEKREKERKERRERGEEVEESEVEEELDEASTSKTVDKEKEKEEHDEKEKKKTKEDKKERRKQKHDDDDDSWDGESSDDSEDIGSDEENKTIVIKEKDDEIEEIKDVTGLTVDKVVTGKADNYFDLSLGKFFMNIGLNLVQEYVQNDLLKQQNRKLYREKKGGHSTKATESSIVSLKKNLEFSKENNAPYVFKQLKCEYCTFKTESKLVMAHHLETPHMKNSVYKCNFCVFESKSPHDILYHMEAEHNTRGKLERAPAYHQCANCPFEDNGKGKLARHLVACAKKFKPELNLAPPIEWEPPAKIPKIARSRNQMMSPYQNAFHRGQVGNNLGRPSLNSMMAGAAYRPRGRSPMGMPPRAPVHGIPILRGVVKPNNATPVLMANNYPPGNNGKNPVPKSLHQPSISITPLPRQPHPQPVIPQPQPSQQNKSTCVICEICDGYIKDLEQLRNHMQWIHKVKIHPKMIYNRPPLNCQKCQFRFFTDQGLERHLLGSHGLVTSSMQQSANKGKDAGRCPVCGRVYQWKLLNHVSGDHNMTLKPAHLSYKCTVCTATFGMYKQFENHVYSAHSVVAKRVMDKGKAAPSAKTGQSLLKPLKINDEITIIPQPVKSSAPVKEK